jgi:Mn-dependent DtxR family transcriptional regulator
VTSDRELQFLKVLSDSLQAGESLSIREIAERVGVSVGTVHDLITRAERQGLVERDRQTRRVVRLNSTGLAELDQPFPRQSYARPADRRREEILHHMAVADESGERVSIRDLARKIGSSLSTIADDLKVLLREGYVQRQADIGRGQRRPARAYRLTMKGFVRARGSSASILPVYSSQVAAGPPVMAGFERVDEIQSYQLVLLRRPLSAPEVDNETLGQLYKEHTLYQRSLRNAGYVLLAGSLSEQPDESMYGLYIYRVGSLEVARKMAERDPLVRAGLLSVDLMTLLPD